MDNQENQKKSIPVRTPTQLALRRFRKSKLAMAGLWILGFLYLTMLFHGFVAPHGENHPNRDYSLSPPALFKLNFTRPDGSFSLRPWFVPARMKRDPKTGENIRNSCKAPAAGEVMSKDYFGQECRYNPQEVVFFTATPDKEDEYKLFWMFPAKTHLFGTRPMLKQEGTEASGASEASTAPLFLFGSDQLGRDIFSRMLYGSQISLTIGLFGILVSFTIGILVGGLSGYYGGWIDDVVQRIGEVFMSVPSLYLILAIQAVAIDRIEKQLGHVLDSRTVYIIIIVILAFIGWAGMARVVRGMVLSMRELDYVTASRALGARDLRVVIHHLLPNTMTYLIIQATLSIPYYILSEVVLSFLGVGIREPAASWGTMLTAARQTNVLLNAQWLLLPGLGIFVTVMAYNLLGDGLRDALDPRQKIK